MKNEVKKLGRPVNENSERQQRIKLLEFKYEIEMLASEPN